MSQLESLKNFFIDHFICEMKTHLISDYDRNRLQTETTMIKTNCIRCNGSLLVRRYNADQIICKRGSEW